MSDNIYLRLSDFFRRHKSQIIILSLLLIFFFRHLASFRCGINYEEARDANAYLLFLQGDLPYRDFDWLYGPFAFYIYPFIMKIFGVNLEILRISYLGLASLLIPLVYFLARRILTPLWAGIAAFLSIIFITTPYYTYNHIFAALGEVASLIMVCRFIEGNKKIANLFWSGIFCSLALLTKPLSAGIALFLTISLFILFFTYGGKLRSRIKDYSLFLISTALLPLSFCAYFFSQTGLANITIAHPYISERSALLVDQAPRIKNLISLIGTRIKSALPLQEIFHPASFAGFKKILVSSFDNLICILPYLVALIILFKFFHLKFIKAMIHSNDVKYHEKKCLFLFTVFSVFISFESLVMTHVYNRAWTVQVPFIIIVYLFYLLNAANKRRKISVSIFTGFFLLYLSFLPVLRYPYANIKKYTQHLNLKRAGGILVTKGEKELYESLSVYLSDNVNRDRGILVLGYYPQVPFLTEKKEIFEDNVYIFNNFEVLLANPAVSGGEKLLAAFEEEIISKIEKARPQIILSMSKDYFFDADILSPRIIAYIKDKYSFDRQFGPADVHGRGIDLYQVYAFKIKER
jgi:hypothetical protein